MSLVSVIIPVYNTEKYIKRCLDSIINQSMRDIEIIVINDGSKDFSKDIIMDYCNKDNRIIFIDKENGGQSAARNQGLQIASSEYVAFVDSDDWIEKDMYMQMYDSAIKNSADIVICDHNYIYEDTNTTKYNVFGLEEEVIDMEKCGLYKYIIEYIRSYKHGNEVWSRLYKKDVLVNNRVLFDVNSKKGIPEIGEDLLFNLKVSLYCKKIASLKGGYYNYLIRKGSSMTSYKPDLLKRSINIVKIFHEEIKKTDKVNKYNNLIFKLIMISVKEEFLRYDAENRKKEFMQEWRKIRNDEFVKEYLFLKDDRIRKRDIFYKYIISINGFWVIKFMNKLRG